MKATGSVLFALAFLLAGCAKAEPAAQAPEPSDAGVAQGSVRGLVIDDSLFPIVGATVSVPPLGLSTRTSASGGFQFNRIAIGDHTLIAEADGYGAVSKKVQVLEGESVYAEIGLERLASDDGYYVTKVGRGILACGVTYRQGITSLAGAFLGAGCNVANGTGVDVSTYFTWLSDDVEAWRGGAAETEWTSTQAFGNGLVQDWAVFGCANNRNATFGRATGPSPLRNLLGSFELEYRLGDLPNSSCGGDDRCNENGCHIINRIFSWPSSQPEDAPVDVGITLQQTFTTYISEFFRREPPPDFTALLDG
jgi:predicted small secreted protein